MFILRKSHFNEGKPLTLMSNIFDEEVGSYGKQRRAIEYRFVPLGFVWDKGLEYKVTCQLVRHSVSFTDSYPSSAKHRQTATWERIDLPLAVESTLTEHAIEAIAHRMDEWPTDKELRWFAKLGAPVIKTEFEVDVRSDDV